MKTPEDSSPKFLVLPYLPRKITDIKIVPAVAQNTIFASYELPNRLALPYWFKNISVQLSMGLARGLEVSFSLHQLQSHIFTKFINSFQNYLSGKLHQIYGLLQFQSVSRLAIKLGLLTDGRLSIDDVQLLLFFTNKILFSQNCSTLSSMS